MTRSFYAQSTSHHNFKCLEDYRSPTTGKGLSFLVAFNGQFSPLNRNVERVMGGIPSVESVYPTQRVREFKNILHSLENTPAPLTHPKIEIYQQHAKSYQQEKKREHAKDIMTSPVKVIGQCTLVSEAMKMMEKFGFRHLPVVNDQNVIVGMISDRELLDPEKTKQCKEIMIQKIIVSDELTSINEVAITLLNERINALPIINRKNEVSGIITLTDILNYVIKSTAFLSSA